MTSEVLTTEKQDIVDALEERGDELSLRAATYIRIKRTMERLRDDEHRALCRKLLAEESAYVH